MRLSFQWPPPPPGPRTSQSDDLWPLAVRVVALVTALALGFWLLVTLSGLFLLLLFAVALAAGVTPLVDGLQRRGAPRGAAVLMMYLALVSGLAVLGFVLIPLAVGGIGEAVVRAPEYAERFSRWLTELQQVNPLFGAVDPNQVPLRDLADTLVRQIGTIASQALRLGGFALGLVEAVVLTVALLLVLFYLLVDGRRIRDYLLSFLPAARRPRARTVADRIGQRMGGWVIGQLVLSGGVGLATFIGLSLLGIPGATLLALVAAVGEVVPIIGPILSAAPAIIVAATQSPFQFGAVAVLCLMIQQLENHLVVPNVMGRAVNLHPLAVMFALAVGSTLLGVMGALAAIPLAAGIAVILDEVRDRAEAKPD